MLGPVIACYDRLMNTAPDVLNIRSIVSHGRTKQQCRASRSNARNLITLVDNTRWSLPVILGVNARLLSIEKADELLSVASLNDVSCVCLTETWFKDFMSDESVGLSGY